MEKIVLSNNMKDFGIDLQTRNSSFVMENFHYHPYYEIYYAVSGSCNVLINHSLYHVLPGDFILISESEIHKFIYDTGITVERYTLFFSSRYVSSLFGESSTGLLSGIFHYPVLHLTAKEQELSNFYLKSLLAESDGMDVYSSANCSSYLTLLLSLLARNKDDIQLQNLDSMENTIQSSARYIYNHFREGITLNEAANAVHMSPTYFSKKFKAVTGLGFKEYLTKIRLHEAVLLLESTNMNITEIALSCGFNDGNYFGDAFRLEYQMSPLQFRKNLRQNHV